MDEKCEQCGEDGGTEKDHSCPYNEDVNGDYSECCNCCDDCAQRCADDI